MNNKTLYWAGGAVIVIALGAFLITGGYKGASMSASTDSTSSVSTTPQAQKPANLKALLASPTPVKCDFSDSNSMADMSGTVYVSGGKARGDFSAQAMGKTMSAHMVTDGANVYTWMDGMKTGYKVALSANAASSTEAQFDANKDLDYRCSGWSPQAAFFDLPAGVAFTDLSVGGNASKSPTGTTNACGACDLISTASQKAQCKAALGCK